MAKFLSFILSFFAKILVRLQLLKNDCAECNKTLCIFCAKNQLDLKTTLVVIVVTDEQVKKITNTFKPLKSERGKGHE